MEIPASRQLSFAAAKSVHEVSTASPEIRGCKSIRGSPVAALEEALARFGQPEIFNTDQGSQFTSAAFADVRSRR